jgi:hypothetical protein
MRIRAVPSTTAKEHDQARLTVFCRANSRHMPGTLHSGRFERTKKACASAGHIPQTAFCWGNVGSGGEQWCEDRRFGSAAAAISSSFSKNRQCARLTEMRHY